MPCVRCGDRTVSLHSRPSLKVLVAQLITLHRSSKFLGKDDNEANRAGFVATVPLGRSSTPQDIANACLYLCSEEGSFITGIALEVDGGRCV